MNRVLIAVFLSFGLLGRSSAAVPDSATYSAFHKLAGKLHLCDPQPSKDEYEVRIWWQRSFLYGAAQMVYVIRKTNQGTEATEYLLESAKRRLRRFTRIESVQPADSMLWNRLIKQDIVNMPEPSVIQSKLNPKQKRDATRVVIEADGSINVIANKTEKRMAINDGESYYFEVFSAGSCRQYRYDNPRSYFGFKPIAELRKVVTILDELDTAFPVAKRP